MKVRQTGVTLISTLVGLLLGLFAALSIMSIFKTQAKAVVQTRTSAAVDGQVATALLVSEMEMQSAGWGVEAAANSCLGVAVAGPSGEANTDFVVVNNATFAAADGATMTGAVQSIGVAGASAVTGNAVFWRRMDDSGASTCAGLLAVGGGMFRLLDQPCANASAWASTWDTDERSPLVNTGTLSASQAISFTVQRVASCTPFGRMTASTGLQVTVSAGQSMDGISSSVTSCIPNICQ